jgi:hypothetical protein
VCIERVRPTFAAIDVAGSPPIDKWSNRTGAIADDTVSGMEAELQHPHPDLHFRFATEIPPNSVRLILLEI